MTTLVMSMLASSSCRPSPPTPSVEQWGVHEVVLRGPDSGNPYLEVELHATFRHAAETVRVPGFHDGDGTYRIRFSPSALGEWTFETQSNLGVLAGVKGTVECVPPAPGNRGPVRVCKTLHLEYADGTPFFGVGTTAYQWTSVKQSIQDQTLETLASAPFNKIRMCVFPKAYEYGNNTEPWSHPFAREGGANDFSRPNHEFFRNFDRRVRQLTELGIQADVILFHPYDTWGYSRMDREANERYVRYMVARISAYRNVWWSLANEWDVPSIKESIDWEGIGSLLQQEDPHQRLRGIHNWYDTEDHFYDHTRPWVTHVSAQTARFQHAIRWRERYQKPLLFDEMRYEGDVPSGWGNLSAQEMTSYFWMAGLSGGHPTHGETLRNNSDEETEVRWWAKGGRLMGESPKRIAWFRSIMEQAPLQEMIPSLVSPSDPGDLSRNHHVLSQPGMFYLAYAAAAGEVIALQLDGPGPYDLEVLDTWGMRTVETAAVPPGAFTYRTTLPYTALRLKARTTE